MEQRVTDDILCPKLAHFSRPLSVWRVGGGGRSPSRTHNTSPFSAISNIYAGSTPGRDQATSDM